MYNTIVTCYPGRRCTDSMRKNESLLLLSTILFVDQYDLPGLRKPISMLVFTGFPCGSAYQVSSLQRPVQLIPNQVVLHFKHPHYLAGELKIKVCEWKRNIHFNLWNPKSDHHEISLVISTLYKIVVVRIKDRITQGEFVWYFNNFSTCIGNV